MTYVIDCAGTSVCQTSFRMETNYAMKPPRSNDTGAIEALVDEIIAANPKQVEQVKEKPKTMGWFVGQVMKASGGKANPQAVNEILKQKLSVDE